MLLTDSCYLFIDKENRMHHFDVEAGASPFQKKKIHMSRPGKHAKGTAEYGWLANMRLKTTLSKKIWLLTTLSKKK
jgi:hypothetical protein